MYALILRLQKFSFVATIRDVCWTRAISFSVDPPDRRDSRYVRAAAVSPGIPSCEKDGDSIFRRQARHPITRSLRYHRRMKKSSDAELGSAAHAAPDRSLALPSLDKSHIVTEVCLRRVGTVSNNTDPLRQIRSDHRNEL